MAPSNAGRFDMEKPKWASAPDWAKWLARDTDGTWHWFSSKPKWKEPEWVKQPGSWMEEAFSSYTRSKDTLEMRNYDEA